MDDSSHRLRVLVSASSGELAEERHAAETAVRTLRLAPVLSEPGADTASITADVFVGIYWESYGWIPPGESTSEIENVGFEQMNAALRQRVEAGSAA